MRYTDKWWSYPAESESGKTVIVTGRDCIDDFRESGKYVYRIDVSWSYNALPDGMPEDEDARLMEEATDALLEAFKKDRVAVITGIYTGDGKRDWVFYTKNLKIFSLVFNKALEELPTIPIVIDAEEDAGWEEYREMREATYVPDED
ncbi:MAG: DUF695 domain-containing protein [Muribaculaceae bacterium]|nr:DUF695 domain-containing protein [Muribaculaceae bacterium]MDE6532844.1 DUF695 domain-containing protein [Muribaculaceae bacterium]MDE6772465.1 DUF695 domain-containing protein [Muribaculaceae bacterium]